MINNLARLALLSSFMIPFCNVMANETASQKPDAFGIYVPNLPAANEFSASTFFLRPGGSNDYGVLVFPFNPAVASPILSPSWEPKGINPDFDPGFSFGYRHIFADSGNDVSLYWGHLCATHSATFGVNRNPPPAQQMTGPFYNIGPDAGPADKASGGLKSNYDVVNLEVGKSVKLDPNLKIRLFTGLSALWIRQKTTGNFSGDDPILGKYVFSTSSQSKFSAAGMRLGIDGEYKGWGHIHPVGMLGGNLYVGSEQPTTETYGAGGILSAAGIAMNQQYINHDSYIQVVPALDGKFGLKYALEYARDKIFSLEAGYQASIYINAIQNYAPSTYVPGSLGIVSGSIFLQSLIKTTESFSVDGPYVTFSVTL